jgi:hypothetical protein
MVRTEQRSRRRFLLVRQESGLTSEHVAQEAGLTLAEEYRAEISCAVEPATAARLLTAFCRLTGASWTLEESAILTRKEGT